MKTWFVPVTWEECGVVTVQANTLKEAMEIAVDIDTPLPDGDYVDSSCVLSYDDVEELRVLYNANQKDEEEY